MGNDLIVFEGVDGTGKSTLANKIVERLGAAHSRNPPKSIRWIRSCVDQSPPKLRYYYYLFGNYTTSSKAKKILKDRSLVYEWYIYSTTAYHSVLLDDQLNLPKQLYRPDYIIYLEANWDSIQSRLAKRRKNSAYKRINFLKKVVNEYERIFNLASAPIIRINTTDLSPLESKRKILSQIKP